MMDLDQLAARLRRRFGLSPRFTWSADVPRALEEMSRLHGAPPRELSKRLWLDQDLLAEFVAYLTVQESYFLRHPEHFSLLVGEVEARLATRPGRLSVLSAGCANGEEPYSVAIMVHAHLGASALERVRILATDINGAAIAKARAGRYSGWSFRGTPPWFVARYFGRFEGSKCLIAEDIQRCVTFEREALEDSLRAAPDASVDFLFFRNVAIYLDGEALERIFPQLHRVLRPGGRLLMAPTDPRPPGTLFGAGRPDSVGVFRRREPGLTAAPPPPGARTGWSAPAGAGAHPRERTGRGANPAPQRLPPAGGPAPIAPPPVTTPAALLDDADDPLDPTGLGDAADHGRALGIAARLIRAEPAAKDGYLLRAWIHFASRTFEEAVADLRRVVFLDREDKIARFWFAIALRCASLDERSLGEVAELLRQLDSLPADMILEDGATTVSELRTVVVRMSG